MTRNSHPTTPTWPASPRRSAATAGGMASGEGPGLRARRPGAGLQPVRPPRRHARPDGDKAGGAGLSLTIVRATTQAYGGAPGVF